MVGETFQSTCLRVGSVGIRYLSNFEVQNFSHVSWHFSHEREEAPVLAAVRHHGRPERQAEGNLLVRGRIFLENRYTYDVEGRTSNSNQS